MNAQKRFPEELKIEAGSQHSLYGWIKQYSLPPEQRAAQDQQRDELRRLKAELKRVTEERDISKRGRRVFCQAVRVRCAFIQEHESYCPIRRMCKVLQVHPIGFYAWRDSPRSAHAVDDRRLLGLIKQSWLESGTVYGYRKIAVDLRDLGESCGKHRVWRWRSCR